MRFSILILLFFGTLVWSNIRNTWLLIGITDNRIPYHPSDKQWPYPTICYFYFDHRGVYDLARKMDGLLADDARFLSPDLMQGPHPHVYHILDQYLTLYSKKYRDHLLKSPNELGALVSQGRVKRILYLDTVRVPFYIGTAHPLIIFDPATTKMVYENDQIVVKEAILHSPPSPPPNALPHTGT
jgi:hypothetical protein